MRKYTLLFFMLLGIFTHVNAQLNVDFSGSDVNPNETVEVDVNVSDFTNLHGVQFSINWDSMVLRYESISNVTTDLANFDAAGAIGVPPGSDIVQGQLTVSWFNAQPQSIPNDTRLFTIILRAEDVPCDSTEFIVSGTPRAIEVTDANFMNIGAVAQPEKIKVNGPDCQGGGGGGNEDDLTFNIAEYSTQNGQELCVPITVENFTSFNAGQGKFSWDPAVLMFDRIENIVGGIYNDNQTNVSNGVYNFIWENSDPSMPVSLNDGDTFIEVCFDVIGSTGDMSAIDMSAFAADWGFTDETGAEPPVVLNNGKVTISDTEPVVLNISDVTIDQGGTGCVSISVEEFIMINSVQGTFEWDDAIVDFENTGSFNLAGLKAADFNSNLQNNQLRLTWTAPIAEPDGVTVPDGTEIFQICFEGVGPCADEGSSSVNIVDVSQFNIEITQLVGNNPTPIAYVINPGMVTIAPCPAGCDFVSKEDVDCNGENTGSIIVNVDSGSSTDCNCVWYKDGSTTPFMTLNAPNCNLINVGAGVYRMEMVCGGEVECSLPQDITIDQPGAISISEAITNVGCGNEKGSIVLSVSGGTPDFQYQWNDPANSTTKDVDDLDPGMYTVTVTDDNMCTATKDFEITNSVTPLAVVITSKKDVSCNGGNDGEIVISITGGCPQGGNYMVSPSDLTNLTAGTYNITVTDFSNPAMNVMISETITEPDVLTVTGTTTGSMGNDGSIDIMVDGGTPNYSITWTGGIADGETNPTGLAPDTYTVSIEDANGCTVSEDFVVPDISVGAELALSNVSSSDATCNGEEDGAVFGSVSGGEPPYSIELKENGNVVASTSLSSANTFMLNSIPAGNYEVVVTDNEGDSKSEQLVVNEPTAFSYDVDVDCANGSNEDGSVDLSVAGGAGNFSFEWSTGETTEDLNNVGVGTYSVLIEDGNGCQAIVNNIRVTDCNPTNCYEAITIITPNGDGVNDVFVINCVMQENATLRLYDRWGKEVYAQPNYDNTWGGVDMDGEALMEGGYMWLLEVTFGDGSRRVFDGTVTILTDK